MQREGALLPSSDGHDARKVFCWSIFSFKQAEAAEISAQRPQPLFLFTAPSLPDGVHPQTDRRDRSPVPWRTPFSGSPGT